VTTQPDWKARAADLLLLAEAAQQRAAEVYDSRPDIGHDTTDYVSQIAQCRLQEKAINEAYADRCSAYALDAATAQCHACFGSGIHATSSVDGWVTRDCGQCDGIGRIAA